MRLAAIQYRPPKGEPAAARRDIRDLLGRAAAEGAELVVLPEMATTGYIWDSPQELAPHSEPVQGPTAALLSASALRHGMWIICGFAERRSHPGRLGPTGRPLASLHNSALVVDPAGSVVTTYRKVLLYEADETWATPGWRRVVVPLDASRTMVPAICMDINDPRFTAFLRAQRPSLLAFCTNWVEEGIPVLPYWRERLAGWTGALVAANTWGTDRGTTFSGRSVILGPRGELLAEGPASGDAVLVADVAL